MNVKIIKKDYHNIMAENNQKTITIDVYLFIFSYKD